MKIEDRLFEAIKKYKAAKSQRTKSSRPGVKKKPPKKDIEDRCTCLEFYYEPHSCPYQYDVNNDKNDKYCTCCPYCEQECVDNI